MFDWITPAFSGVDVTLTALVVLLLAAGIARATPARLARVRAKVEATPDGRVRQYRSGILASWVLAGISLEPALLGGGVTLTDLGLGGIDGVQVGVAAGVLVVALPLRIMRGRWAAGRLLAGHRVAGHEARLNAAFLIPRTRRERWWAAGLAVTAGITEEIVYRGLLITAGVGILGLDPAVALLLSAVVFGLSHRYQGLGGMLGTGITGLLLTALYALTGNLLAAMALHAAVDLAILLAAPPALFEPLPAPVSPAGPSPTAPPPSPAGSGAASDRLPDSLSGGLPGALSVPLDPLPDAPRPAAPLRLRAAAPE